MTKNGCSSLVRISTSLSTFFSASRSMHWCLFMYFIANICFVSFFCTMHTCRKKFITLFGSSFNEAGCLHCLSFTHFAEAALPDGSQDLEVVEIYWKNEKNIKSLRNNGAGNFSIKMCTFMLDFCYSFIEITCKK